MHPDGHALFEVSLKLGEEAVHSVWRRFSAFTALRKELGDRAPPLPKKRFLKSRHDRKFLEERRSGLEHFCRRLLRQDPACANPVLRRFLLADLGGRRAIARRLLVLAADALREAEGQEGPQLLQRRLPLACVTCNL